MLACASPAPEPFSTGEATGTPTGTVPKPSPEPTPTPKPIPTPKPTPTPKPVPTADTAPETPPHVLLFTKTAGFRHGSIDEAVEALEAVGKVRGWTVTHTEDAAIFSPKGLASIDVVVFLLTTGDVLDDTQQTAMEAFIAAGGGFAGVHSATDTEYDWPWYGELVGAYFDGHPSVQDANLVVDDASHPATAFLGLPLSRRDEWYAFAPNPRGTVHVLLSLDESSYTPGEHGMDGDHPIAWTQEIHGGRSFYTGGGHTPQSYEDDVDFVQHLAEGIAWAAGR